MIKEDYVSFETAKLLKEKDFNGDVDWYYRISTKEREQPLMEEYDYFPDRFIQCPSLSMVMKWLREIHNIFFNINYYQLDIGNKWVHVCVNLPNKNGCEMSFEGFDLESQYDNAIKYCLQNLI